MTTISIDFTRPFTTIGGRLPLKYMQNGYGFNPGGKYLGRCNVQGELLQDDEAQPQQPAVTGIDLVGETVPLKPAGENQAQAAVSEGTGEGEQTAKTVDPEAIAAHYQAKPIKELKSLAKAAEIPGASNLNKAALVEALTDHDAQDEDAA